jgi:hypothetical protein
MSDYIAGLDLGQLSDYTALAIVRRQDVREAAGVVAKDHRGRAVSEFAVVHLERFALGTPYPIIVESVRSLLGRSELGGSARLAVDGTGVGRPVVDMLLDARFPVKVTPITITAGAGDYRRDHWHGTHGPAAFWVAKVHLVGTVQAALSTGRLRVADRLPLAALLRRELLDFRMKITPANNATFAAREGQHDDLVLAVAIAIWLASTPATSDVFFLRPPEAGRSVWDVDLSQPLAEGFEVPPPMRRSLNDIGRDRGRMPSPFTSAGQQPPPRPPDEYDPMRRRLPWDFGGRGSGQWRSGG